MLEDRNGRVNFFTVTWTRRSTRGVQGPGAVDLPLNLTASGQYTHPPALYGTPGDVRRHLTVTRLGSLTSS
ncbi:MAG: hypothetical protein IPF66_17345 [Holophagales bacterium]|nr:hypothetical protein [Holophagales bacterium]